MPQTLWASTACYRDSFAYLYVDDVSTSQGKHLWASTACYRDSFAYLYVDDVSTSQGHTCGPPRPVTEIALQCYM
jgi:hypothetical protein